MKEGRGDGVVFWGENVRLWLCPMRLQSRKTERHKTRKARRATKARQTIEKERTLKTCLTVALACLGGSQRQDGAESA